MEDLRHYNEDIPVWAKVLLWPLQSALATGFIIVLAVMDVWVEDDQGRERARPGVHSWHRMI